MPYAIQTLCELIDLTEVNIIVREILSLFIVGLKQI